MNRKVFIIIMAVILVLAIAFSAFIFGRRPPAEPTPPSPPATPDSPSPPPAPTSAATLKPVPTVATDATQATLPDGTEQIEEMDLFEVYADFPVHFISHEGGPIDEGSRYLHATVEIAPDGTMSGEFFSNMESTDKKIVEHHSSWTGRIRDNKLYHTAGVYYFYVADVKYKHQPDTSEEVDGRLLNYVCGYGLDPKADNRIELFAPGTLIDSLNADGSQTDIRQFLTTMFKNGEADALDCYLLRGKDHHCYVSITEEEARMDPPEQPEQPQQPEQPEKPEPPV